MREYVVWRVLDAALDWFVLRGTRYERVEPDDAGVIRGDVFPGLVLDVAALLAGDGARVLARGREALGTPEHAAFVARLAGA